MIRCHAILFPILPFYESMSSRFLQFGKSPLLKIKSEFGLSGIVVRSVALIAPVGKDGLDMKIIIYNFGKFIIFPGNFFGNGWLTAHSEKR